MVMLFLRIVVEEELRKRNNEIRTSKKGAKSKSSFKEESKLHEGEFTFGQ
jgi:hypothetical protein